SVAMVNNLLGSRTVDYHCLNDILSWFPSKGKVIRVQSRYLEVLFWCKKGSYSGLAYPVGGRCQLAKALKGWLGQHVFRATPAPVALDATGQVHSGLRPEVQHILERSHRECRHGRPCQADQFPSDFTALTGSALYIIPNILPLVLRQSLE